MGYIGVQGGKVKAIEVSSSSSSVKFFFNFHGIVYDPKTVNPLCSWRSLRSIA